MSPRVLPARPRSMSPPGEWLFQTCCGQGMVKHAGEALASLRGVVLAAWSGLLGSPGKVGADTGSGTTGQGAKRVSLSRKDMYTSLWPLGGVACSIRWPGPNANADLKSFPGPPAQRAADESTRFTSKKAPERPTPFP